MRKLTLHDGLVELLESLKTQRDHYQLAVEKIEKRKELTDAEIKLLLDLKKTLMQVERFLQNMNKTKQRDWTSSKAETFRLILQVFDYLDFNFDDLKDLF